MVAAAVASPPIWNPTSPEDKEAKEAFTLLNTTNDKVVLKTEKGTKNRFILHSKGYFDLQAYVLTGKDLPQTDAVFDEKMPEKAWTKLKNKDAQIYPRTKRTMVNIGSQCADFHNNHLQKLVTAGSETSRYADTALEWLEKADDPNVTLKRNINILLDPKYKSKEDQDDAYRTAKENAQQTLGILKSQAEEKKKAIDEIVRQLIKFREETKTNQTDVKYLTKQYKGPAPIVTDSDDKTPYLEFLQKDLNDRIEKFKTDVAEANKKYGEWAEATAIAVGTCWFGPIGWIAMGIHAEKAARLRGQYDTLMSQISQMEKDNKEETELITNVNKVVTQFEDLDQKMSAAITALQELAELFDQQGTCFDKISTYIGSMKSATDANSLSSRKAYMEYNISQAIKKLEELKELAAEFKSSIMRKE